MTIWQRICEWWRREPEPNMHVGGKPDTPRPGCGRPKCSERFSCTCPDSSIIAPDKHAYAMGVRAMLIDDWVRINAYAPDVQAEEAARRGVML